MNNTLLMNLWREFLLTMKRIHTPTTAGLWFGDCVPITIQNGTFFIVLDSDFKRDVVTRRYQADLEEFFSSEYGNGEKISVCWLSERDASNLVTYDQNRDFYRDRAAKMLEEAMRDDAQMIENDDTAKEEAPSMRNTETLLDAQLKEEVQKAESTPSPAVDPFASFVPPVKEEAEEQETAAQTTSPIQFVKDRPLSTTDKNGNHLDFEHFVVGNSNKFAHAACLAVAQKPASSYNPLFIHGPSGLGKTHLLKAVIHHLQLHHPELKIRYVKGDEFTNQMIESISFNRTEQFRENYRKVDVLLIDDIQFIAGKESTQEEFFHTFNALYEDNKQIILTSDRPPKDIPRLEDRLRTRFEWGLTADINPPDLELRVAILKNKSAAYGISMSAEVLTLVAENLRNNVRQLEGAVKKIAAQSLLLGQPITKELAFSCISDLMSSSEPIAMTSEKILTKIAEKYEVTVEDIKGTKRTKQIATPRHVAVYMIRELTNMSFPQLGKLFDRDHTTILNSYQTVVTKMKDDPFFEGEIKELLREFQGM